MAELRVLVADDEAMARARVLRLLSGVHGVQVVQLCADGAEVLAALEEHQVDAVLLDIQMPGISGTQVAELLGPSGPLVVFLTAHAEYAVQAFQQGAVDYVLKPIEAARLELALDRVRARLETLPSARDGKLALPTARGVVLIAIDSIRWCGIDGQSVVIHADRTHHSDLRLADLERRLPANFQRLHRRALVNRDHITRLDDLPSGGYLAHLDRGDTVEVSRAAARRLRREWSPGRD